MKFSFALLGVFILLSTAVFAVPDTVRVDFGNGFDLVQDPIDGCHDSSYLDNGLTTYDLEIQANCSDSNIAVNFEDEINLSLGDITAGEVESGHNWFAVDTNLRPDLDKPATIIFLDHGFFNRPTVLRNGVPCEGDLCNMTFFDTQQIVVEVGGFSNYSLQAKQDFVLYSDAEPELKDKTYQTIDLGADNNSRRAGNYTCVVQVFGRNQDNTFVLVQTNPQREVQSRLFGSPDPNQPESLGYFPVVNGIANTYFRGDQLTGYSNFELVIQCASTTEKLVYEEAISTRYSPLGRTAVSRGVWLTDGSNAFYVVIFIVVGILLLFIVRMVWRRLRGR